ncbi:MAG TPA: AAA family ATPase, partial [Candidatus Angelobacter sp.]
MRTGFNTALDPTRRSSDAQDFETALRRKIVGQDPAVEKVVEIYQMFLAGLNAPGRPVGNLLFLGPTGSGKTRVVEAVAESLFGDPRAIIKIDCAEFQHSHEIAKLIGSPPGYLGHRETHPLLT